MFLSSIRVKLFFTVILLAFGAGCTSAGASSNPTSVPVPTAVPASSTTIISVPTPTKTTAPSIPSSSAPSSSTNPSASGDTVRLVVVPGKSQAGYRVREQLASVSFPTDAVGTTSSITGAVIGKTDGTIVSSESKFVVDLSTLKSDNGQRDNFLRQNVLQTSRYREATFVPTSTSGLPKSMPANGQVAFKLIGDLTIHNVTKSVTWDVTCQSSSATEGTCNAMTTFTFGDFGLTIPKVFTVLSIVDSIKLEVSVDLQRS